MQLTATVHYACGVQFWVVNGPDDRVELERRAHDHANWIGGRITDIAPTTGEDMAALATDHGTPSRSQPMWVEIRLD